MFWLAKKTQCVVSPYFEIQRKKVTLRLWTWVSHLGWNMCFTCSGHTVVRCLSDGWTELNWAELSWTELPTHCRDYTSRPSGNFNILSWMWWFCHLNTKTENNMTDNWNMFSAYIIRIVKLLMMFMLKFISRESLNYINCKNEILEIILFCVWYEQMSLWSVCSVVVDHNLVRALSTIQWKTRMYSY